MEAVTPSRGGGLRRRCELGGEQVSHGLRAGMTDPEITCSHDEVSILEQDPDDIPVSILLYDPGKRGSSECS